MTIIRLLARVKGIDDSWQVRVVEHGQTADLVITRGASEPITIELCAQVPGSDATSAVRWSE